MRTQRKKVWIHRFQTFLCIRLIFLFVCYQAAAWLLILVSRGLLANLAPQVGGALVYWLVSLAGAVITLGLLYIYDTIIFTHRMVGPLYRFRQTIKAITANEEVVIVKLRKDDFLQEMRDDINEMLMALEQRGAIVIKKPEGDKKQAPALSAIS